MFGVSVIDLKGSLFRFLRFVLRGMIENFHMRGEIRPLIYRHIIKPLKTESSHPGIQLFCVDRFMFSMLIYDPLSDFLNKFIIFLKVSGQKRLNT
jgi:hypothetical protein